MRAVPVIPYQTVDVHGHLVRVLNIFFVLTCEVSTVNLDLDPLGGNPAERNDKGRLILPFLLLSADRWGGWSPRRVPVHG